MEFLQSPVVQGVSYRVIDLAVRLFLPGERLRERIDVVLLRHEQSRGSVRVQKVHGILEIQRSQVLPLPAQFRGPERRWYRGLILFNHSVALVLNTAWVFEEQIEGVGSRAEPLAGESIVALHGAIQSKSQTC
ncbi:MAG: chemotaxis protein CheW [Nitrospira sp.]